MPPIQKERKQQFNLRQFITKHDNEEPVDIFNRRYAHFGYIITIAFYAMGFASIATIGSVGRFGVGVAMFVIGAIFSALWGMSYASHVRKLMASWSRLSMISTGVLIIAGFMFLTNGAVAPGGTPAGIVMFLMSAATFGIWAMSSGTAHRVWDERNR